MLLAITLVAPDPDVLPAAQERAELVLPALSAQVQSSRLLGPGALDLDIASALTLSVAEVVRALREELERALDGLAVDVAVQPSAGRRKRLFLADMDSTIIGCECLDELADFAGVKAQVSAITERAMRGEIDFTNALTERVAMLKNLPLGALQQCYDQRVRLNPGARTLVRTLRAHGVHCVLVSGGFSFFTERVAAEAGFHRQFANRFVERGGVLTGEVRSPILGQEAKLATLRQEAQALEINLGSACAIGDGANDLAMIEAAGLGVAYRAKPVVAAQADARIDHADLTALLYFQGYGVEAFDSDPG
jgi:phosphoserine phosphatase